MKRIGLKLGDSALTTFTGAVVGADGGSQEGRAVVVSVTDTAGVFDDVMLDATVGTDGTYSVTTTLAPGAYEAGADVAATKKYTAASSDIVPFTVNLVATTITLNVS